MRLKSQPWIHSWYGDLFAFSLIPILFVTLAFFELPPFGQTQSSHIVKVLYWVIVIDWAHIFAQWYRIYSNPLESNRLKCLYPLSYLLLIPVIASIIQSGYLPGLETFLIYFVIFHFIKQHYGFIKIYSKADGKKSKFELVSENAFIYLTMWTPVLYWHMDFPKKDFYWVLHLLKIPYIKELFFLALILYAIGGIYYLYSEIKRWIRNKAVNWPKNIAIFTSAIAWGAISFLSESNILIFFSVVLTHDISYILFVWFIGRRDERIISKKVSWLSWWSIPGFFIYVLGIIFLSQIIMAMHMEMAHDSNRNYLLVGTFFNNLPSDEGWWKSLGLALFYATQAHHYFIDKYLWKKEKDLDFLVKTGKYSLS